MTMEMIKKMGQDDPRRILHSLKVGSALTIVSLLYYFQPLYDGFGQAGMWAILTVIVVFEFTVGGTLSKSINRGVATLVAGALGVGAEYLAALCGEKGEPIILGLLVFILATGSTFVRFFPNVKRRYDYGVLIFILTFSLVAVSGVRAGQILELAHQRLSTILIGGLACIVVSVLICPVWAGQDLHNHVVGNIEKLAAFFEGFANEFDGGAKDVKDKSYLLGHKTVLNSKATEESLANFAWWEPRHGQFKFKHPWQHYLKIGSAIRECAYKIEALHVCINNNNNNNKNKSSEFDELFVSVSTEFSHVLKQSSASMKNMEFPSAMENFRTSVATALKTLLEKSSLSESGNLQEVMPKLVIATLLLDIVGNIENIRVSVEELAQKAGFEKRPADNSVDDGHAVVIEIGENSQDSVNNITS